MNSNCQPSIQFLNIFHRSRINLKNRPRKGSLARLPPLRVGISPSFELPTSCMRSRAETTQPTTADDYYNTFWIIYRISLFCTLSLIILLVTIFGIFTSDPVPHFQLSDPVPPGRWFLSNGYGCPAPFLR